MLVYCLHAVHTVVGLATTRPAHEIFGACDIMRLFVLLRIPEQAVRVFGLVCRTASFFNNSRLETIIDQATYT
jgi:hypothetical protein